MALFPLLLILIVGVLTFIKSVRIVRQHEKGLVLRLGKYKSTVSPGLNLIIPYIDSIMFIDMRERVINVEPQKVITEDNVAVTVDAAIYYKIVDPVKAEFEVEDFDIAVTTLAQTNLRNLIGDKTLDETLTARDIINSSLRDVIDEATNSWGVKITRVEVQKIDPPPEIIEAMSLQMRAEREKRASILEAEGVRQSQILQAQGKKDAAILEAEGIAKSRVLQAEAEAEAIKRVAESANKYFDSKAEKWRRLEVATEVFEGNTKFVIPTNSDIVNVLNLEGKGDIVPVASKKKA